MVAQIKHTPRCGACRPNPRAVDQSARRPRSVAAMARYRRATIGRHVCTRPHRPAVPYSHTLTALALHLVAVATVQWMYSGHVSMYNGHENVPLCGPAQEGAIVQWLWRERDCHARVLPSGDSGLITSRVRRPSVAVPCCAVLCRAVQCCAVLGIPRSAELAPRGPGSASA